MQTDFVSAHLITVGVLAISLSDNLLDDVGTTAWERSGGLSIEEALPKNQFSLIRPLVVPGGNRAEVASILRAWCDAPNPAFCCRIILTLGGDGFAPRDIVPDATRDILERETPGISDMLRQYASSHFSNDSETANAPSPELTRGTAGIRKSSLIVNLPSCYPNPAMALEPLLPLIHEALETIGASGTAAE